MIVWSVANQKGGVGKTTSTIALAGLLTQHKKKVLVVDTDPHASLTSYLNFDTDALQSSLFDLFTHLPLSKSNVQKRIIHTPFPDLDLLPADMSLATLDRTLGSRGGMGLVIKKSLAYVEDEYDHVLIDCPPILGVMMVNALAACDRILIPVQTEFLAMKGLERMIHTLELMEKKRHHHYKVCIVPTMYDKRTRASLDTLQALKTQYSDRVWTSAIPIDTKLRDASLLHVPPSFYSRNCRGVFAYKTLLSYLERLEQNDHLNQ